ncbi:ABC transporter ATP-binding protein [Geminicoccaceae bacterium 1502E]|nr:ABC transporter ATP-binding protein [Geminicoccaceae bacterium 1502E]
MRLEARGIRHRYAGLEVLGGIDLAVEEGETVAVLGPSGCGKSTFLGIAGGLLQPEAGTVVTTGAPPQGCLNPLTYVFQDFALLPWRTVEGNIALPLEGRLEPQERAARIDEVLARIGLADFRNAWPRQLSGGMRQRVGIARALAVRPAILLMDEPLSALDAQTRELLLEEFVALRAMERLTTIWITHNLEEAVRVADRICVLSRRPARIKAVLRVDVPASERGQPRHAATLRGLQEQLWALIADEVRAADRELEPEHAPEAAHG